jgi:hypothetical protein
MRGGDLLLLLGLLRQGSDWSVRSLAHDLHLPQAAVQRSLARLDATPAYDAARRRVSPSAVSDLLRFAIPFVAPARLGAPTRGMPTAWATPPLSDRLAGIDELPPVWPAADGDVRGLSVDPLHSAAVALARSDPWMYEMLALVDGVRLGDARIRGLSQELLGERLATQASNA